MEILQREIDKPLPMRPRAENENSSCRVKLPRVHYSLRDHGFILIVSNLIDRIRAPFRIKDKAAVAGENCNESPDHFCPRKMSAWVLHANAVNHAQRGRLRMENVRFTWFTSRLRNEFASRKSLVALAFQFLIEMSGESSLVNIFESPRFTRWFTYGIVS